MKGEAKGKQRGEGEARVRGGVGAERVGEVMRMVLK